MIKAIQTRYAGYMFRSRLEARWAVFFDALKLDWAYEPEGFQLPSGTYYLPDFRVIMRDDPVWFEIKPGEGESEPFAEFMRHAPEGWRGAVLNDIPDPRHVFNNSEYYPGIKSDRPYCLFGGGGWDNFFRFCVCPFCSEVGFEFDGRSARIGCKCVWHSTIANGDKTYSPHHRTIIAAFAKARAARFEHDLRETYAFT